jgi:hypothetical protein
MPSARQKKRTGLGAHPETERKGSDRAETPGIRPESRSESRALCQEFWNQAGVRTLRPDPARRFTEPFQAPFRAP